ncbi:DUF4389 domain-containing protein [Patescibacteria group bacterium]|nr:DUF4389 domain-containing protein [Patescibacteria group bacterium]
MDKQSDIQVPPKSVETTDSYPVTLEIPYPEHPSRLWALGTLLFFIPKMIALLPHLIILSVLVYLALIVTIIGQVAVLFTGRYPRSLFDIVVGYTRWQTRFTAFYLGLTDKYPPFTFK